MDLSDTIVTGRRVAASGTLIAMTHAELANLVHRAGGDFVTYPRQGGLVLVVGEESLPTDDLGKPTHVLRRAQVLMARGYPVRILRESEFLEQMGLLDAAQAVHGLHSATDLVRLLNVSGVRLRRWMRMGLIRPVEQIHGLPYFDFRQAASAKRLVELVDRGVTAASIRQGLKRIEAWLPPCESVWSQLARLEADGRPIVRVKDMLIDDHGQQQFDFESEEPAASFASRRSPSSDSHFDAAIRFEDAGDLEHAAEQYRLALSMEPQNSVLHFNLANVCYALHDLPAALEAYRYAIECDPSYVEAWNNMGSALLATHQPQDALQSLKRAIELNPSYADAHYNLALVFEQLGGNESAAHHRALHRRYSSIGRLHAGREPFLRVISPESAESDE